MLSRILQDKKRYGWYIFLVLAMMMTFVRDSPMLTIDCAELQRANSDTRLVDALSRQTGYWPVFTFLDSINNLIDLASVGLIGQKGIVCHRTRVEPTEAY